MAMHIIPNAVSAGLDTVGIRLPRSAAARGLIRAAGVPIAAPSGNRSGRPSPTTAAHMLEDMDGRIPLILDGGPCEVGLESSVIDATGEHVGVVNVPNTLVRIPCGDKLGAGDMLRGPVRNRA